MAEQLPDLIIRQRIRQPLLPRYNDPFFPGTDPNHGRVGARICCVSLVASATLAAIATKALEKVRGIVLIGIMLIATAATPADTNAVLYSEQVLKGALSDIAKMREAELRAFTHYLSACGHRGEELACSDALTSYWIEFGGTRPLDDLMIAINHRDRLERSRIEHGGEGLDSDWVIREVSHHRRT